jgi:GT2 family glycosyltransferase
MISVIIATKNRHEKLLQCLLSIATNTYRNFEVIVADQSTPSQKLPHSVSAHLPHITHFPVRQGGKPIALNEAIKRARGSIIAFTDDDCIVKRTWLAQINSSFQKDERISGFFGRILPYKPSLHRGEICPSTFTHIKRRIFKKPIYHAQHIGFGNNMAIHARALEQIGQFRTWLGPGSVSQAADDADLTLRLLLKKFTLAYNPDIIVSHNKWLTPKESRLQALAYARGEGACYGYFMFHGHAFARSLILSGIRNELRLLRKYSHFLLRRGPTRRIVGTLYWTFLTLFNRLAGMSIALYYRFFKSWRQ